jgi:hypothetical protein
MKLLRLLFIVFLVLVSAVSVAYADCTSPTVADDNILCDNVPAPPTPGPVEGQSGNDSITIDTGVTISNYVTGDDLVGAGNGNDTIINNGTVDFTIFGDTQGSGGSGDDYIVNNGTVNMSIEGDGAFAPGSGDDTIINNGSTDRIYGDSDNNAGTGNDTITNNGTVNDSIFGDTTTDPVSTGNDIITNNGVIVFNIYGDEFNGTGTGSDTITNNGTVNNINGANGNNVVDNTGTVNGSITTGADTDTVTNSNTVNGNISVGDGNDTVIIQGNDAIVGGTMDGGNGTDVLTFNLSTDDPAQAEAWAAEFAAANPNGGTITINGQTYTWTNFEELQYFIELTSRPQPPGEARRPFCAAVGGLDIYVAVGNEGVFSLYASAEAISAALSYARVYEVDVTIETSETSQLWALISGEIQVRTAEGEIVSTFFYQNYCGDLPEADPALYITPTPTAVEEYPSFTIINQPYGG